jgi:pimeloyl-ACP methyl ester carboxylesterase
MSAIAAPKDTRVAVGDVQFHVRIWSETGPPIVLLHGLASSAQTWNLVAPLLAPDFQVVALDERGHGESDKPDTGYDLATFVEDVAGVIQALRLERPTVVGQSWGGNVALQYAVTYPEAISHLVLVDGGFSDMQLRDGLTWEVAEKNMTPPDLRMPFPAFVERIRNRLGSAYSDAVRDAILGNLWVDERGVIHPHLTRERHLQLARAIWEHRTSQLFEKVQCPTLVVPAEPPDLIADPERLRWKRRGVAAAEQRLPRGRILWMHETPHDIQLYRAGDLASAIAQFVGPGRRRDVAASPSVAGD